MVVDQSNADRRSLFMSSKGTSLHLTDPDQLEHHIHNAQVYAESPLVKELHNLGFPMKSLNLMLTCNQPNGYIVKSCNNPNCNNEELIPLKNHCDMRTCPVCAKRRKQRVIHRFLPYLREYKQTRTEFLYLLTISPKNYNNLKFGLEDIRKNFAKFRRLNYVKDRLKAGFYVLETKQKEDGTWNIHIHCVAFGRWLDNRIRGKCLNCGQNLMKFDRINEKYYCANKHCNSLDVVVNQDSKLTSLWRKSIGHDCHMHIKRLNSVDATFDYVLKYVSVNKDDFISVKAMAQYIYTTKNKRLLNSFGLFRVKIEIPKKFFYCNKCGNEAKFKYDLEVVARLLQAKVTKDPPPESPEAVYEIVKI